MKLRLVSEINPRISEKRDKDREKDREREEQRDRNRDRGEEASSSWGGNKRTRSTDDCDITTAFPNSAIVEKGDTLFVPPLPSAGRV